ncbi:hypothetical protein CLOM_g20499 [Closterium sp. NIES-68]|nr:hypothetical protein CLOM_g20499 [Closterium sp. NIES-68]
MWTIFPATVQATASPSSRPDFGKKPQKNMAPAFNFRLPTIHKPVARSNAPIRPWSSSSEPTAPILHGGKSPCQCRNFPTKTHHSQRLITLSSSSTMG